MKLHKWSDIKAGRISTDEIAQAKAATRKMELEMSLRDLREEAGLTQVETAKASELAQATLSRLENGEQVPTVEQVRRYVEALGGKLEIVAVMGRKRITLAGI